MATAARIILLALMLLVATAAITQPSSPPVYGVGSLSCPTFISDVQRRGEQARALYFSWVQGFISAANALLQSPDYPMVTNLTGKIGLDAQQRTLGEICEAKPNQDFSRAAMELLDRIRSADGLKPLLR
jgi:hypothetical protein